MIIRPSDDDEPPSCAENFFSDLREEFFFKITEGLSSYRHQNDSISDKHLVFIVIRMIKYQNTIVTNLHQNGMLIYFRMNIFTFLLYLRKIDEICMKKNLNCTQGRS